MSSTIVPPLGCLALALVPLFGRQESEALTRGGNAISQGVEKPAQGRNVGAEQETIGVPDGLTSGDWAGIRQAYAATRHAAHPVEGGLRARNPGQQWSTLFDGRGFTTTPDAGGWTWGLELVSYGFLGKEYRIEGRADVSAEGSRVSYRWDESLEEWYVNDGRGLEHGYTLRQRPLGLAGQQIPLTLTVAVQGPLKPALMEDCRGVRFLDERGAAVLTYAGLTAVDADGIALPSRLELSEVGLRILVAAGGARYPISIDPIAQQAYLKASNTNTLDQFGAVAVSGDTAVIGAQGEASAATGVNGDQSDNSAFRAGAAYVFVRNGSTWTQQAYLKASNTDPGDNFGNAVAIAGDTIVVGASEEDSDATGVNGDGGNNNSLRSGAAYVFVRSGTTWSQQAYLKASNTGTFDRFGVSVALSDDTAIVGAYWEDSGSSGVNADGGNDDALDAGAAYVFVRNGTMWAQQAYLKASNTEALDDFGISVDLIADTAIVGAAGEDSSATGVNGDESDNSATQAGAAYVFVRSGTTWSQQAYLKASNADAIDIFGVRVSIADETIIVGAAGEDSSATGVNGDESDNSATDAGAAYVFVRSSTTWSQEAYLKASNTEAGDSFGSFVAISGDTAIVGAPAEGSNAMGVNGDADNNNAPVSGAAYLFLRNSGTWNQDAYLKASNAEAGDAFGSFVAISGDTAIIGAPGEDSNGTGVNADGGNNSESNSGAGYVFFMGDLPPTISSVLPSHGPNSGLTGVVIMGSNFTDATEVSFGSNGMGDLSFTVDSNTQITVTLFPTNTTGYVDVSVTAPSGIGTRADGFDYFVPPVNFGHRCASPYLFWSGSPTLGQVYTITTLNLGADVQYFLLKVATNPPVSPYGHGLSGGPPTGVGHTLPACLIYFEPDIIGYAGMNPTANIFIPNDPSIVGMHLLTQAAVYANPGPGRVTTQALDALIGE